MSRLEDLLNRFEPIKIQKERFELEIESLRAEIEREVVDNYNGEFSNLNWHI